MKRLIMEEPSREERAKEVALRSEDRSFDYMDSFTITFLLDISGSMAGDSLYIS